MKVAIAHDYLTQRGGAERVVLAMARAFPDAAIYTSLYDARATFPEFASCEVRTLALDRLPGLHRNHRLALPLLAAAFTRLRLDVDVAICSSSGWAHGTTVSGRKIIYCHTPARWLYQADRYAQGQLAARVSLAVLGRRLREWDRTAASTADVYLANSTVVRRRIQHLYQRDAQVLHPPHGMEVDGELRPVGGVAAGFFLCVSRLLPYKNVGAVVAAFRGLPDEQLVVAGTGPDEPRLRSCAPPNVSFVGAVTDSELRWLYAHCCGLVSASYEDFGLTPVEAAAFGKPSAVLRYGGFLDTVVESQTGFFFDRPVPSDIEQAVRRLCNARWDADSLLEHAARFSQESFIAGLRAHVDRSVAGPSSVYATAVAVE